MTWAAQAPFCRGIRDKDASARTPDPKYPHPQTFQDFRIEQTFQAWQIGSLAD